MNIHGKKNNRLEETTIINNSNIILENATEALYSQSSNLDKDRVAQLIK